MTARKTRGLLIAAVVLIAGGCTFEDIGRDGDGTRNLGRITLAGSLQPFDACEDFLAEVKAQAKEAVGPFGFGHYGYGNGGEGFVAAQGDGAVAAGGAAGAAGGGATEDLSRASAPVPDADFSTTNVQEKGIDEPDIVKTNGEVVVVASGGMLRVIEPGDTPKQIGLVDVPGLAGDQILMVGDRVLVFGAGHDVPTYRHGWMPNSPQTRVSVVSIENPAEPRLLGTTTVDGSFVNARLIDGTARLVVQSGTPHIPWVQPSGAFHTQEAWDQEAAAATARNRELIDASAAEDWLPSVTDDSGQSSPLVDCERIHHPEEPAGTALTTVLSVDRDGNLGEAVSVMANAGTVYASSTGLYVATMEHAFFAGDVAMGPPAAAETQVHRFDISDAERAYYVGSGKVPGQLLNQFSMSEHDGRLRVATTRDASGRGTTDSLVTVLEPQAGQLVQVGQVDGLGKTERIYSVRFIGDMGYVVTFRQTDPLYVIDLSDPTAPAVKGELKINGYSAYLHPISDTLLLGVGQDATDQGQRLGMQLSLFDVSDPAAPKRLHQATLPNTQSEAEWDHHAFLYWAPAKLAVVPVFDYRTGGLAAGFSVDAEGGIEEIGRIEHAVAGDPYQGQIRRSIVIGDRLYTLSENAFHASALDSLADLGELRF